MYERIIFKTELVKIGVLRCGANDPDFRDPGPTQNYVLVFPRSAVSVIRADGGGFLSDPTIVSFWNRNELYHREAVSPEGVVSEWFAVDKKIAFDVVRALDPAVEDNAERPFRFTHAPSDPGTYLFQRRLLGRALAAASAEGLLIEEGILYLLNHMVASACRYWGRDAVRFETMSRSAQDEIVFRAAAFMAKRFREPLSIGDIAREVGASAFHLSRLFKKLRNSTLHAHLNRLRLRSVLEYVLDTRVDLTQLALDLGYSSHSHFTWAFHREFGLTPSDLRSGKAIS